MCALISIIFRTCALNSATTGSVEARDFYCAVLLLKLKSVWGIELYSTRTLLEEVRIGWCRRVEECVCASELPFWVQALEVF